MCEYCNLQKYEKSWEIDVLRKTVDIDGYTELVLKYNKNTKEYSIHAEGEGEPTFRMKYCPNCGRNLIENEGGISYEE